MGIRPRPARSLTWGWACLPNRFLLSAVLLAVACVPIPSKEKIQAQSLGGSASSLDRQGAQAAAHGFTYLESPGQVRRFVDGGYLVPVVPNRDMELHQVSFPYARPEVRLFVERLAAQYRAACGEKLVVTSLTRPLSAQPWNASDRSVHPTGMAVDFRRSTRSACRSWLESTLVALEGRGVLEATRERRPPHYHLAVYPELYAAYVTRLTGSPEILASRDEREPSVEVEMVTHSVRRGESLGSIANRYDVTVNRIRSENEIRGDRILVGQRLRVPVYRVASASPSASGSSPAAETGSSAERAASAAPSAGEGRMPGGIHTVSRGESLWTIARQYGVDEADLRRFNGLAGDRILPGQKLTVPGGGVFAGSFEHTVRRGESLWTIARAYRVSEDGIRAMNGLRGSRILVGQILTIPGEGSGQAILEHTVEEGESLWTIANRHQTTVEELRRSNGIRTSRIYAGQRLNVPLSF